MPQHLAGGMLMQCMPCARNTSEQRTWRGKEERRMWPQEVCLVLLDALPKQSSDDHSARVFLGMFAKDSLSLFLFAGKWGT